MCDFKDVFIVGAARTPIGNFLGSFKSFSATDLGGFAIKEALSRAGITGNDVDEVIMGNVVSAGNGQAPAKQASVKAGIPYTVNSFCINKVCGSALKAVALGFNSILLSENEIVVAGGMESMSQAPHLAKGIRNGIKMGDIKLKDSMIHDGLWCAFDDQHMGMTGEFIADKFRVTREEQDKYASLSHKKAIHAMEKGYFNDEIVPVEVPQRKSDPLIIKADEGPRKNTTFEKLSSLRPVFKKDGTITAGNASSINDGAAAIVLASQDTIREKRLKPLAKILGFAKNALEPKMVMYAPKGAIQNVLANVGWSLDEVDLFEINEAFASQLVALIKDMDLPEEKINVHGGAISLGHPIGATGARIIVSLLYALKNRGLKRGVAALCLGGGDAVALAIEIV